VTRKYVIITGSSGDIGHAITVRLISEGYRVIALYHNNGQRLHDIQKQYGDHLILAKCDLTNKEEVLKVLKIVKTYKTDLVGLVNCTGIASGGLFMLTKPEVLLDIFNVNYFKLIEFTQYIAKILIRNKKGSIINLTSTAGQLADRGTLAYGGSKAAVIHSSKVMAAELGQFSIRVNCIAPGVVDSSMSKKMDRLAIEEFENRSLLPGQIKPDDVAAVAFFLMSDDSKMITGQTINVDKGVSS
jgi:3-oxoacyl-[acyl-carrier protein] reductase